MTRARPDPMRLASERGLHLEALRRGERLAALGNLAAAVAHEIKNPLSALDIHLQLLEEHLPPETRGDKVDRDIEVMHDELARVKSILENFIRFARSKPLSTEALDMTAICEDVASLLKPEAASRGIGLCRGACSGGGRVRGDADRLQQVILNLMINAIQAMQRGGALTYRVRSRMNFVVVGIEDDGPGVPESLRDRIFDLYFTTKAEGTGLGLPIAAKIASEHGGALRLSTRPGGGARFELLLPVAPSANG